MGGLREAFELGVAQRALDTQRVLQGMLVLQPKSRTAFQDATDAYAEFAISFNRGELVDCWPLLAELQWSLLAVQQSEDWELRDHIDPKYLRAVHDLQQRVLDAFAQMSGDAPTREKSSTNRTDE